MSAELEPRVLEGAIVAGGVAQSVTREDGVTRVRLTVFGALAPQLDYEAMTGGGPVRIPFAEPVEVTAGEAMVLEVDWRPGPVTGELRGLD